MSRQENNPQCIIESSSHQTLDELRQKHQSAIDALTKLDTSADNKMALFIDYLLIRNTPKETIAASLHISVRMVMLQKELAQTTLPVERFQFMKTYEDAQKKLSDQVVFESQSKKQAPKYSRATRKARRAAIRFLKEQNAFITSEEIQKIFGITPAQREEDIAYLIRTKQLTPNLRRVNPQETAKKRKELELIKALRSAGYKNKDIREITGLKPDRVNRHIRELVGKGEVLPRDPTGKPKTSKN